MILLSLVFVFIPFVSFPGLFSPTYTQPIPLLLGWIYLGFAFSLSVSKSLAFYVSVFLLYILVLGFLHENFSFGPPGQSVFIAYCIGFSSFMLLLSLFKKAFRKLCKGDSCLARKILGSARLTIFIVASTSILQINPGFSDLLSYFKPRHVGLDGLSLNDAFRGLSGVLPEPSYVGTTCAVMLLVIFWFSFRIFIEQDNSSLSAPPLSFYPFSGYANLQIPSGSQFYSIYGSHLLSFFASWQNLFAVIASFLSVFLAFSPTSLVSYILVLSTILVPPLLDLFRLRLSIRAFSLLAILLAFLLLSAIITLFVFPDSRLSSLVDTVSNKGLSSIVSGSDKSSADRAASSIAGFLSIFYYPLGLGLNGHGALFADCSEAMIVHFDLLCGSLYSSPRNHNSLAVYLMDGGLVGILIAFLAFGSSLTTLFAQNFGSFSWVGRLNLAYLIFLFVVLPAPLGAPSVWIALALILSFFSIPVGFKTPGCCPDV